MIPPCAHLAHAAPGPAPFEERVLVDWDGGTTLAIVDCVTCGATFVLELLDWDTKQRRRIYRVAPLDRALVAAWEEKGGRPTCKTDQARLEIDAVLSRREATAAILALDVGERRLLAARSAVGLAIPTAPWRALVAGRSTDEWFHALGLAKRRSQDDL